MQIRQMKKWGIPFLLVMFLMGSASTLVCAEDAVHERVKLYPIVKDGKWGYMDQQGKVVIEPQYDGAWDFSEGLACVGKGLLRGYIDRENTLVIKHLFGWASKFKSGRAAAYGHLKKGKPMGTGSDFWGDDIQMYRVTGRYMYIDRKGVGKEVPGRFNYGPPDFREGKACFSNTCMGTDLKLLKHDADEILSFSDGLAAARRGGLWGYLDHDMKWVIEPKFHVVRSFGEGMAPVAVAGNPPEDNAKTYRRWRKNYGQSKLKWGFINKKGEVVVDMQFEDAWEFSHGLAPVCEGGKWGFINKSGEVAIPLTHDYVWPFSEGKARFLVGGRTAVPTKQEGVKKVTFNAKFGYLDTDGKVVIEPIYNSAWEFDKGLARVAVGMKEGYINHEGTYVWEPSE